MATFSEFITADSATLTLNAAGVARLKYVVEQHANFDWVDSDLALRNALAMSESGFDSDGVIHLELGASETKSGQPYAYELDFDEHFDCEIH